MIKKATYLLVLCSFVFLVIEASLENRIDEYIQEHSKEYVVNGVVLIAHGDCIKYHKAFGYADREKKKQNTLKSQFLIGSITKIFTAAAILKLVDQGALDTQQVVSHYIPSDDPLWKKNMPEWANIVTIHHLLTHSAGLAEYTALPNFDNFYEKSHSTKELLQFFVFEPLIQKPGEKFNYSGSGYNLLGAIIEEVSKKPYGTFLKEQFFKPLHMTQTFAPHHSLLSQVQKRNPYIALGYNKEDDDKQMIALAGEVNLTTGFAEASIISTACDMYKFARGLFGGRVLSKSSFNKMIHPYLSMGQGNEYMGYGIDISKEGDNVIYYHFGRFNGYESVFIYDLQSDITLIMLNNVLNSGIFELCWKLLDIAK